MSRKPLSLIQEKARSFSLNLHLEFDTKEGKSIKSPSDLHSNANEKAKRKQSHFASNKIKTTKYTVWSFLPKSIMSQFNRYANIYFILIAILQCFPEISQIHPANAIAPLIFVLGVCMVRDAFEDYRRYKSDNTTNNFQCESLRNGSPFQMKWKDIMVGDVILVKNEEIIPADLILLSSSEDGGLCFLETSSLDGEKNLKTKVAQKSTYESVAKSSNLSNMKFWEFLAGKPTGNIYHFEGNINVGDDDVKVLQKIMLNEKQLLLRGAKLKNTRWILGTVVYSGMDCRMMRNTSGVRVKQSNIERKTNKFILWILLFQILCSIYCAIQYYSLSERQENIYKYFKNNKFDVGLESFIIFLTYFQLTNTMIPISLIVSLEIVKICQAYFMNQDEDMYSTEAEKNCKVMSSSVNEELGQVEYLFTDKTGTLTCNRMEFKLLIVGHTLFGEKYLNPELSPSHPSDINLENGIEDKSPTKNKSRWRRNTIAVVDKRTNIIFSFRDKKLKSILKIISEAARKKSANAMFHGFDYVDSLTTEDDINQGFNAINFWNKSAVDLIYQIPNLTHLVKEVLLILSTCHECVIEREPDTHYIHYMGPSTDELALVDAARNLGFTFIGASKTSITVEIFETRRYLELLHMFPFDSYCKRMSIVVRDNGVIKLYMKGADSSVNPLLDTNIKQVFKESVEEYVQEMSEKGFRSLYLAMKVFSEEEWQKFQERFENLIGNEEEIESENHQLQEEIEKGLFLVGAVGVEDKLQEKVPETIKGLFKAKIKIWMLTGDKMETAENIGRSCKLIQTHMSVLRISHKNVTKDRTIQTLLEQTNYQFQAHSQENKAVVLLIDGSCLGMVLNDITLNKIFLEMSQKCQAVICCRVTPGQKAEVVRQIKHKCKKITLAVGDGDNDVAMIQEANIGVGIYGQEGTRACQAGEYAIGEFRFLWKLLLVHGRWSYMRVSKMTHYFLYKNMVLTFPQLLFSYFSFNSGQTLFDDWYISSYNLLFTAIPVVVRAVVDYDIYYKYINTNHKWKLKINKLINMIKPGNSNSVDISDRPIIRKNYPLLYDIGQENKIFRDSVFLFWFLRSLFDSTYIFFINFLIFDMKSMDDTGVTSDLWTFSISTFTCLLLAVDLKLALGTDRWNSLMIISVVVTSIGIFFGFILIIDQLPKLNLYKTAQTILNCFQFFSSFFLSIGILLIFDLTRTVISKEFFPTKADLFQYLIKIDKDDDIELFRELEKKRAKSAIRSVLTVKPISIKIKPIRKV